MRPESVHDEKSFLVFAKALANDRSDDWQSTTIAEFLESATRWAEDSEFGERPGPKLVNPWRAFAQFLWAGRSYE